MNQNNSGSVIGAELKLVVRSLEAIEQKIASLRQRAVNSSSEEPAVLSKARQHYKHRREREKLFGTPDLFGEPAWDMLIDLFIAAEEGKKISVSSLCLASAVPMTTALRWISILESRELIHRTADSLDARRSFLSLAAPAHEKLRMHFERAVD